MNLIDRIKDYTSWVVFTNKKATMFYHIVGCMYIPKEKDIKQMYQEALHDPTLGGASERLRTVGKDVSVSVLDPTDKDQYDIIKSLLETMIEDSGDFDVIERPRDNNDILPN